MGNPKNYKKDEVVENYDENRFENSHWRKKYFDIFERGCVTKWIQPGNMLDVGCGTSRFGFLRKYTGADFSEKMIEKAREKHPENDYVVADAKDLPFEDNSFENVFSTRVIMHVDNWKQIVEEMHRVCKPDGRIIFDIKPPGPMSVLLRLRDREISRKNLRLNIITMDELDEYKIVDTADFPPGIGYTRFVVIQKQQ